LNVCRIQKNRYETVTNSFSENLYITSLDQVYIHYMIILG